MLTRSIVTIPFAVAIQFLANDALLPRQYFEQVYPVLINEGIAADYTPLTNFFQLAATDSGTGASVLNLTTLPIGSRHNQVTVHYDSLIQLFFLQLNQSVHQLQQTQITTQIASLSTAYQQARAEDKQLRDAKAQTSVHK